MFLDGNSFADGDEADPCVRCEGVVFNLLYVVEGRASCRRSSAVSSLSLSHAFVSLSSLGVFGFFFELVEAIELLKRMPSSSLSLLLLVSLKVPLNVEDFGSGRFRDAFL